MMAQNKAVAKVTSATWNAMMDLAISNCKISPCVVMVVIAIKTIPRNASVTEAVAPRLDATPALVMEAELLRLQLQLRLQELLLQQRQLLLLLLLLLQCNAGDC